MRIFPSLERAGRELSAVVLGKLIGVPQTSLSDLRRQLAPQNCRKILLVKNYQGMGDLLCASPVLTNLKARFPKASIHFLANTFNASALQNNPHLEKTWLWDERRKADPRQWIRLCRSLRQERFDLALILSGTALSLTAILLAASSKPRWIAGYETEPYGQSWGKRLYSAEVPSSNAVCEIDRYLGLLEGLGIPCPHRAPEFFVRPDQVRIADDYWKKNFSSNHKPVVGIFLGGKVDRPDRIWPAENFARVARRLTVANGCAILAIAPPLAKKEGRHKRETSYWLDEELHVRQFAQAYQQDCPVFRHADLGCVAAVLQKLNLFICPDGGMMHIAAARRVPTLTLFLGTSPEVWHPPVATSRFLQAPRADPRALDSETVAREAAQILKQP